MTAATSRVSRGVEKWHRYGYPLVALVRRDVKQRYASTALGLGWAVLQPLVLIVMYVVVFAFILRVRARPDSGPAEFALYLLCGMLPYLAITDALQRSSSCLRQNRSLLERVSFPAEVIPAISVVTAAIPEVIGLALVIVAGAVLQTGLTVWVLLLPLLFLLRLIMTLGIAWLISILTVFVGDFGEGLSLALTALLFLTPVFYAPDAMPAVLAWTMWANPLYPVVAAYRAVVLEGRFPMVSLLQMAGWAALLWFSALRFFRAALNRARDLV